MVQCFLIQQGVAKRGDVVDKQNVQGGFDWLWNCVDNNSNNSPRLLLSKNDENPNAFFDCIAKLRDILNVNNVIKRYVDTELRKENIKIDDQYLTSIVRGVSHELGKFLSDVEILDPKNELCNTGDDTKIKFFYNVIAKCIISDIRFTNFIEKYKALGGGGSMMIKNSIQDLTRNVAKTIIKDPSFVKLLKDLKQRKEINFDDDIFCEVNVSEHENSKVVYDQNNHPYNSLYSGNVPNFVDEIAQIPGERSHAVTVKVNNFKSNPWLNQ